MEYSELDHYYTYHVVSAQEGIFPGKFINYYSTLRLYRVTDGNRYQSVL